MGHHDLSHLPASRVDALARMATTVRAQAIARMAEERRTAVLLAFARVVETCACDDALELFDLLLRKTFARAERVDSKKRLRSLKAFEAAALQLAHAYRVFIDPDHTSLKETRQATFDVISREALLAAVETVEALARQPGDERPYPEILKRYAMLRRVLPQLSETIAFDCTKVGRPVLATWNALRGFEGRKSLAVSEVAMPVVSPAWRRYVSAEAGLVDRRAYTLAVVDRFCQGLQRREIFVARCMHFGDPRTQLLDGVAWKTARLKVSRMLELPLSPKPFLQVLRDELAHSFEQTATRLGTISRVVSTNVRLRRVRSRVVSAVAWNRSSTSVGPTHRPAPELEEEEARSAHSGRVAPVRNPSAGSPLRCGPLRGHSVELGPVTPLPRPF